MKSMRPSTCSSGRRYAMPTMNQSAIGRCSAVSASVEPSASNG